MSRQTVSTRQFVDVFYALRIVMERLEETYSRVSTTQGNAKKCGKLDELVERDYSLADELCFS